MHDEVVTKRIDELPGVAQALVEIVAEIDHVNEMISETQTYLRSLVNKRTQYERVLMQTVGANIDRRAWTAKGFVVIAERNSDDRKCVRIVREGA